ncbi:hypothetical protein A2U01_0119426, partial [Trifolium medium]|nr:hypothetical protein [Trifolium medium]
MARKSDFSSGICRGRKAPGSGRKAPVPTAIFCFCYVACATREQGCALR